MNLINYSSLLYNSNLRYTAKNSNFLNSFSSMISKNKTAASNANLFSNGVINDINFNNFNKHSRLNSNTYKNYLKNKVSGVKNTGSVNDINEKKPVKSLSAKNNVIEFSNDYCYTVRTKSGASAKLAFDDGNLYKTDAVYAMSSSDYKQVDNVEHLLTYLAEDKTGMNAYMSYSNSEIKDMLSSVGIEPGFFEVKSNSKTNKFYVTSEGSLYPEYQVEETRDALNRTNWFTDEEGFTKDSKLIIDGTEYKIDDSGHVNIPKGVGCVFDNIKIIK